MSTPHPSKAAVLNSWKEIAHYLGRGVRTVQRYERNLGLPVRRPHGKSRSAVIAPTAELDEWLRNIPQSARDCTSAETALPLMASALQRSARQNDDLRQLCQELRRANMEAVRTLSNSLRQMQELLRHIAGGREELISVRKTRGGARPN